MIILFTRNNIASFNIAKKLIENHNFKNIGNDEWRCGAVKLIGCDAPTVLEVPANFGSESVIVLSTHKSKIIEKIMTVHFPGNWAAADMGGNPQTLNCSPANLLRILFEEVKSQAEKIGWKVGLEADHHGPTGESPMIFAEIGSGEEEWNDSNAAEGMANAIMRATAQESEQFPVFFAVGGGHYPKKFEQIMKERKMAISHVAPKYAIEKMDEKMFRQAIEKCTEKVERVLVLKDETNAAQKKKIIDFAEKFGIECEIV